MNRFNGLIAAPFTPMDEKGEIMLDRIPAYYDFLEKNGIAGAFINGSTGEGVSLTTREKMNTTEKWMEVARQKRSVKIINLVGGTSYKECIDLAQYSEDQSVDAIALVAPYYVKPASAKYLAEFCAKVAESVPELPVYYYHIPVLSGCSVAVIDFLKEASGMIPNLAGVKYTHEDFMDFLSCLRFMDGKYEMLWGRDENLLSALVLGARGAVGSTYNYAAPLYNRLIEAFDQGDLALARELQMASINMITLLGKYGGMGPGKAYMKYIGFDCGEFRSPVKNLNTDDYDRFAADVKALRMENFFSVL
ncbi:MAG: dihydrodipicolinate synthase family protein [Bacteroidales bacterium]|nr:dihydrodipicolinate synthase family protein [Bacteroidales bacterium]